MTLVSGKKSHGERERKEEKKIDVTLSTQKNGEVNFQEKGGSKACGLVSTLYV